MVKAKKNGNMITGDHPIRNLLLRLKKDIQEMKLKILKLQIVQEMEPYYII